MIELISTGIEKLVQQLSLFVRGDAVLRMVQAANAPQCMYEGVGSVSSTAVTLIQQAQTSGQDYSVLVIQFTSAAQAGYWACSGADPKADGTLGMSIAAGGAVLTIMGVTNIQNFKMIAATGNTMPFAYQLYR